MEKKTPLELEYIKTLSSIIMRTGGWPTDTFGEKLSWPIRFTRATLPYHASIIALGGFYCLYENMYKLSFVYLGHMIITTFLAMVTALRSAITHLPKYISMLSKFIYKFHLMHFAHKGPFYKEMNEKVDKFSHYYTKFIKFTMYVGMVLFNISPIYGNLRNTVFSKTENYTMEYSVYFSFPGFNPLDHFIPTTIYNCYLSYNCSTLLCGMDLLMFLMIFQIIGHVNILRHNLENMKSPKETQIVNVWGHNENSSVDIYDEEENERVHYQLAEYIEHHKLILSFTDDLSDSFGAMLAFNYFFHMIACCLLLLECSGGTDAFIRYGPLTIIIFAQLIQMSVMFELLGSETEKFTDSVYNTPWECMSVSNQRTVCIILQKMQYKISLKALGLASVGVNTMTGILKTTFSYYAFLRTMGET